MAITPAYVGIDETTVDKKIAGQQVTRGANDVILQHGVIVSSDGDKTDDASGVGQTVLDTPTEEPAATDNPALVSPAVARSIITVEGTGQVFDAAETNDIGTAKTGDNFRRAIVFLSIDWAGTNDSRELQIKLLYSPDDGTTWFQYMEGPWGDVHFRDNQTDPTLEAIPVPHLAQDWKLQGVSSGGTYSATDKCTVKAYMEMYS
jgi:hypothetical protein